MKKINVITLGCSKNTVDSEHLMARLAAEGYEIIFDSDSTDAKVVVINTCGFIGDAKQESVDMILRAAAAKQAGRIERLFVVGCLSERYADELRQEIPEVDEYFGAMKMPGMKQSAAENLSKAQAVKDATMAWSIAERMQSKLVHMNGNFHSTDHSGIITYLNQYRPGLKIGTVEVIRQENTDKLDPEALGKADFFICVPKDMTSTF